MKERISEIQQQALDTFWLHTTVPLFRAIGEDADHLATGTFVAVGQKLILLTARHILDSCKPEDIAIAETPNGLSLRTLGKILIHKPNDLHDTEIDILGIEVHDQEIIDIIKAGWRVVDITMGAEPDSASEVMLIGYPSATLKKMDMRITGRPTKINSALLDDIPSNPTPPTNPALDMFLQFSRTAVAMGDKIVDTPPIKGMSGCAIWQLSKTVDGELWSPDHALRLVGIQSSVRPGSYFRGKRWAYIRLLLNNTFHE